MAASRLQLVIITIIIIICVQMMADDGAHRRHLLLVFSLDDETSVHAVARLTESKPATAFAAVAREDAEHVDCAEKTRIRTHLLPHTQPDTRHSVTVPAIKTGGAMLTSPLGPIVSIILTNRVTIIRQVGGR